METFERTYLEEPSAARLTLPDLAADCHVHVFGPVSRFPYAAERKQTPLEAPKEKLFALHRKLGIQRCVIVQSVIHGLDNRVVEDAIDAGQGRYLGVALVSTDVTDEALHRLAQRGFRGVRFNFMRHLSGGATVQAVLALTPRLKAAGLHLQVHFESSLVHSVGQALLDSQVPVVVDHMARVDATLGAQHADFRGLLDMLQAPHVWVKVSGIDRINAGLRAGSAYPQGVALAQQLVARYPHQCVWGLDWPHPNHTHIPDDGELLNALAQIAPTPQAMRQLLVDNPERLYRFEAGIEGFR